MKMIGCIVAAVLAGISLGWLLPSVINSQVLDNVITYVLAAMLFGVGISIGHNRRELVKIKAVGWRILLVPLAIAAGSLLGASIASLFFNMSLKEVLVVGAGFGWYSLSSVLITQLYNAELGAIAFLANVFRELMAFVLIPFLAIHVGKVVAIAPGGATTMDSTLPIIAKMTDTSTAMIAFVSGLILTTLVPFLIPLLLTIHYG
ncbi:lysine exporter LysO family protein [Pelosinus sp. IPA-1]|uniref:lysine exporter LysO family protein n=1 Tax=Pelosinus sp. IPA-1 TaxID=3029569 RepID=UPI0024361CF4|nr:lysine exporter LysO family protein [Pelosinus sp. IPA-1]GMB01167.1 membrane protein [Pelosinus sp. IPA-1]